MSNSTIIPAVQAKLPAQHDGLAVASLIFTFLFWPLGIVFGHASNHNAQVAGRKRSALAVAGLVISYLGMATPSPPS